MGKLNLLEAQNTTFHGEFKPDASASDGKNKLQDLGDYLIDNPSESVAGGYFSEKSPNDDCV